MLTLFTFGPYFGLSDPSPFVTKADVLLKMSGISYQSAVGNLRDAPKGKLPFIEDAGVKIGDSTLIRLHVEQKYGVDFDSELSASEQGVAWSIEKMLEDNLYWALVHARWMNDSNFYKGPVNFFNSVPAPLRPFIVRMVRGKVRRNLHGQGLGRHSESDITALANRAIDALAAVLGDKPYLLGRNKCAADATAFAFVSGILCEHFDTRIRTHAEQHQNLVAYRARLHTEFYS